MFPSDREPKSNPLGANVGGSMLVLPKMSKSLLAFREWSRNRRLYVGPELWKIVPHSDGNAVTRLDFEAA